MNIKKRYQMLIVLAACLILLFLFFNPLKWVRFAYYDIKMGIGSWIGIVIVPEEYLTVYYHPNQKDIDVTHYDMDFKLDMEEELLFGDVSVYGNIIRMGMDTIVLNFNDDMDIETVTLNDKTIEYDIDDKHLYLYLNNYTEEKFTVNVKYNGKPRKLGFGSFTFDNYKKTKAVYTLSEPIYASSWFPCNDLPDDKATLNIKITNDSSYVSPSNGRLIDVITNGAERTYHWSTEYPIASYLIALYSAKYDFYKDTYVNINNDTILIHYYVFKGKGNMLQRDLEDLPQYLNFFENCIGEYPFKKDKYGVGEILWEWGAIENQTITGVGEQYIGGNKLFEGLLIHELAHEWFGNSVTIKTWNDVWLSEGFATYMDVLYWENKTDARTLRSMMKRYRGRFSSGTVYASYDLVFGEEVYHKGAWVLHMLRREVGDTTFFKLIRNYYNKFKYNSVSTEDFVHFCEEETGKNLKFFFDQWVYTGEGIIELEYYLSASNSSPGEYKSLLNLEQVQSGYDTYKFPLDLVLINKKSGQFVEKKVYITQKDTIMELSTPFLADSIKFDPNNWLLFEITKK